MVPGLSFLLALVLQASLPGLTSAAGNHPNPCAAVSQEWAKQKQVGGTDVPIVDGRLAYDCLNSVPLHADEAVRLVEGIQTFLPFHSTFAWLKNPPHTWPWPAVDIPAAMDKIIDKIKDGTYKNEYEFQADLYATYALPKDQHFRIFPDLLSAAIQFRRPITLVSVSYDAVSPPNIYALDDVAASRVAAAAKGTKASPPSPVRLINNVDAVTFIENESLKGQLRDRDSIYTAMFWNAAQHAAFSGSWRGYFAHSWRFGNYWPGDTVNITFANGTAVQVRSVAEVVGDFSNITDGPSFYEKYCSGARPVSDVAAGKTNTTDDESVPDQTGLLGYPEPEAISRDGLVSGYYVPDTDIAVVALIGFAPNNASDFQHTLETFLQQAKAAGKTKVIVDVSANPGGWIAMGYEAFRQFFPQTQQEGFNRWHASDMLSLAVRQFSDSFPPGFDPATSDDDTLLYMWTQYPNYRFDLNETNQPFTSVPDKFGPEVIAGDNFTRIHRWDPANPYLFANDSYGFGIECTGYGSRAGLPQLFDADSIVLLNDGTCGSTCSIFSDFMRIDAGVRTIGVGGRPTKDQIQWSGGTKGSANWDYSYFTWMARQSLAATDKYSAGPLSAEERALLKLNTDTYTLNRTLAQSFNVRNSILRDHLTDGVPAHFLDVPADCRLYHTPDTVFDPIASWVQAADAAWGRGGCVNGSLPGAHGAPLSKIRAGRRRPAAATIDTRSLKPVVYQASAFSPQRLGGVPPTTENHKRAGWSHA